ncbi:ribonuclease H-like domain-containing protein [Tanacetum coccineum]
MDVHSYTDNEYEHDDQVTLISKLDVSNPLHLHPNDSAALTVISVKLKGTENYQVWSCAMLLALEGKNITGFIDGSCKRSNTDKVLGRQWDRLMKLMQFLMGLDDSYMQIRSNILSREPLHDVRNAYAIISSEESRRVVSSYGSGTSQRPSNTGNRRPNGGSAMLICDISKLRIMVSHPNGTEALITKVGNMKLTEHLTLYDVLVVFEYYASLMSVHKVARDIKFVIAFDESHCYVLPQDLREMKVLKIGKQMDGLYYFDGFQGNDLGFEKTRFTCNLTKET